MAVVHLVIHGRVQGVGFRLFVQGEAEKRGLDGWVRNTRDGTVEAVVSGADGVVEDMIEACWEGPPASEVTAVDRSDWPELVRAGFTVEPTA